MTKIYKSFQDFKKRDNKKENGVSEQFALENTNWEADNEKNEGCWNCRNCSYCSDCIGTTGERQ